MAERTVGGFMPSPAPRSRNVGPPPAFAVDAVDAPAASHAPQQGNGPIMSAESPVVSRRRSQPSSQSATPSTSIVGSDVADPYADLRASRAVLASIQPGRLSCIGAHGLAAHQQPDGAAESTMEISTSGGGNTNDEEEDEGMMEEEVQPLPLLPAGRMLLVNCLTNWGDPHFVGLAGVDVFDDHGRRIELRPDHVFSNVDPAPAGNNDVKNVAIRPFNTTDDGRMWLAPYTKGNNHVVVIVLPHDTHVSLLRIWNYNNGRVHTNRGARLIEVTLDDKHVFRGEVAQATGDASPASAAANAETMILSEDEGVLTAVAATLEADVAGDASIAAAAAAAAPSPTSTGNTSSLSAAPSGFMSLTHHQRDASQPPVPETTTLSIEFLDTWGSAVVVGLSAIRLLDADGNDVEDVQAAVEVPSDVADAFAAGGDAVGGTGGASTPLSALFDADPQTAWFARLVPGLKLRLDLQAPARIATIQFANAGIFDRSCGARTVAISRNGSEVLTEDLVLRKSPAALDALLFQTVRLSDLSGGGAQSTTVASSITARAAIGFKRAAMLQQEWPAFYADAAPAVALLPVGYVFELRAHTIEPPVLCDLSAAPGVEIHAGGGGSEDLTVHAVSFDEFDDGATPDRLFAESPACVKGADGVARTFPGCGVPGRPVSIICAFDQLRCLNAVTLAASAPAGRELEVAILVDDTVVFEGLVPLGARTVIPFTRHADFLAAHQAELVRAAVVV
jgi:hypothetical protein